HAFQSPHHLGELLQRATAVELARVMSNRLDAKDAFAFGIDLQSQLAAVQLEDRQIIRRSLDRDFPFGRSLGSAVDFRTMLASDDGLDGLTRFISWTPNGVISPSKSAGICGSDRSERLLPHGA